jgi:antitoxin MazE
VTVKTKVQKWGNSLAVRIPKAFADQIRIETDSDVDLSVNDGVLTVTPALRPRYKLEELVAGITDENRHEEVSTGASVGNEAW